MLINPEMADYSIWKSQYLLFAGHDDRYSIYSADDILHQFGTELCHCLVQNTTNANISWEMSNIGAIFPNKWLIKECIDYYSVVLCYCHVYVSNRAIQQAKVFCYSYFQV